MTITPPFGFGIHYRMCLIIWNSWFWLNYSGCCFLKRNYGTNHRRIDFWAGHVPLPQQSSPLDVAAPIWRSSRMIARLKDDMGLTLDVAKRRANKVLTRVYLGGGFTNISICVLFKGVCNRADFWMIFRALNFCCFWRFFPFCFENLFGMNLCVEILHRLRSRPDVVFFFHWGHEQKEWSNSALLKAGRAQR